MRVNLEGVVSSLEAARDQLEEQVTRLNGELAEARSDLKRVNAMLGLAAEPKKSRPKAKSNGGSVVTPEQIEELKPIISKMKGEFSRTDLMAGQKQVGERGRKSIMYIRGY
jgi:hypothetical protein